MRPDRELLVVITVRRVAYYSSYLLFLLISVRLICDTQYKATCVVKINVSNRQFPFCHLKMTVKADLNVVACK